MTTYTLRKGNPAKTRTDLVVVGVTRSAKGELAVTPGAEDVAGGGVGCRWRPLLASMGFKGDHGEVLRLPTDGVIGAGQLLVVGLGAQDDLTLEKVRRAAGGVAARNLGNAASVALALPAGDAAHVGAVVGGFVSAATPSRATSPAPTTPPWPTWPCSARARQPEAVAALETARTVGALVDRARDWVNTPPNDLDPTRFADDVVALVEGKEHRKGRSGRRGPRRRGADRARLRRHPRRRAGLGHAAPPGHAHLGARRRRREHALRRPGRQGHHLRLGRPEHQVGSRRWP